jgi:predicted metal-dependent phosphoesterase TrpH
LLGDLHIHTKYSLNANSPKAKPGCITEIIDIFNVSLMKGLSVIAITDHDSIKGALEAVEQAKKFSELTVIPGVEISSKEGHILGLNLKKDIRRGLYAQETIDRIIDSGGYPVIAHPFDLGSALSKIQILKLKPRNFGIEIFNSRAVIGFNKRKKFVLDYGFPFTAGSDAHMAKNVGNAYVKFNINSKIPDELIEEIRTKKVSFYGRKTSYLDGIYNALNTYFH